jgi:hypothetical protein
MQIGETYSAWLHSRGGHGNVCPCIEGMNMKFAYICRRGVHTFARACKPGNLHPGKPQIFRLQESPVEKVYLIKLAPPLNVLARLQPISKENNASINHYSVCSYHRFPSTGVHGCMHSVQSAGRSQQLSILSDGRRSRTSPHQRNIPGEQQSSRHQKRST